MPVLHGSNVIDTPPINDIVPSTRDANHNKQGKTMSTETTEQLTGADADYGYRFGCDGLVSLPKAARILDVHENTIRNYCEQGLLRKGKRPLPSGEKSKNSKTVVCRRSLDRYIEMTKE